jgi:hypothetical protein
LAAATLWWSGVALFRGAREYVAVRREFGGKTVAEQHRQTLDPNLHARISAALRAFPTGAHVNVVPKRSLARHWFYYETYPYLIMDSTSTNEVDLTE